MSKYLSKRPKLLIVSDTAVYIDEHGTYLAFEPVVREIEHFAYLFDSIIWIAAKHPFNENIKNIKEANGVKINYVLFPAIGGKNIKERLRITIFYFWLAYNILINIFKVEIIHSRGPSHAAIISAFYSLFLRHKIFWHKYAGNWIREEDPLSYRIQKYLLRKAKKAKIAVNGTWPNQPPHILAFENPCLCKNEIEEGKLLTEIKDFNGTLDFVFVGSMVDTKGVKKILEAFIIIQSEIKLGVLHMVGDGPELTVYKDIALKGGINVKFYGFLSKAEINKILALSHILLLPSDSEGFPKVIAEGANYGCIPIVSDISCLSQYIRNNHNGFIMSTLDTKGLVQSIKQLYLLKPCQLKLISLKVSELSNLFTYEHYCEKIKKEILNNI